MKHTYAGTLITLEGIEGAGKSTIVRALAEKLAPLTQRTILTTREPGGTAIGKKLTRLLLEDEKRVSHDPKTEFLLFAADRAEHFTTLIVPTLLEGGIVISDRMSDSSYAYQGYGRGLPLDEIDQVNRWATQGITPHLTLYIKIGYETSRDRVIARSGHQSVMERELEPFWERVIAGFDELAARESRITVIDGEAPLEAVITAVWNTVHTLLLDRYGAQL